MPTTDLLTIVGAVLGAGGFWTGVVFFAFRRFADQYARMYDDLQQSVGRTNERHEAVVERVHALERDQAAAREVRVSRDELHKLEKWIGELRKDIHALRDHWHAPGGDCSTHCPLRQYRHVSTQGEQ